MERRPSPKILRLVPDSVFVSFLCPVFTFFVLNFSPSPFRCENRRISGRGSRTVRQGRMVTGDKGHDVFTQVRALSMEVIPYSCLINIDDMGSTRVDLPRDQGG